MMRLLWSGSVRFLSHMQLDINRVGNASSLHLTVTTRTKPLNCWLWPSNTTSFYCLPSKTTHKLQPLDVGVFGPLQTAWARHTQQRASKHHTITRDTVIHEYMTIRAKYMTERTIISAFRRSGMWPINPGIFDAQDFAPSLHSSTQNSAPSSYPLYIASSPFSCRTTDATDPDWVVTKSNTSSSASSDISESTTLVSSLFSLTSLN